jgi:hypothetical protein
MDQEQKTTIPVLHISVPERVYQELMGLEKEYGGFFGTRSAMINDILRRGIPLLRAELTQIPASK